MLPSAAKEKDSAQSFLSYSERSEESELSFSESTERDSENLEVNHQFVGDSPDIR